MESSSHNITDDLEPHQARSTYLITYSQADLEKVPSRQDFAQILVDAFNQHNKFNRVTQWACSKERHKNGGYHYHMALKLNGIYRWCQVKKDITEKHGIVVNFTKFTSGYYDAYSYTIKKDKKRFVVSEGHPIYTESPLTKKAMAARCSRGGSEAGPSKPAKRPRRLEMTELFDTVVSNNIRTDEEFCNLAQSEKLKGNDALANFVLSKDEKRRNSILSTAWKMQESSASLARKRKTRTQLMQEALSSDCISHCDGRWYTQAIQTLTLNQIQVTAFCSAVKELLEKGRGKHRNILLVGNNNCGKTFVLKPLKIIFNCFLCPSKGTFNWVGADKKECVFLNDFRWSEKVIPWSDFLNLLEGEAVHVPVPKTHFAEDALWTADTPIFATSKTKFRKYEGGIIDEIETEMMQSRWKVFHFIHRFSEEDSVDIDPCPHCFARLILEGPS